MTVIRFELAPVRELLAHAKASPKHAKTFPGARQRYGLWLVGDEGIYLLSNGRPALLDPQTGKQRLCECEETRHFTDPGEKFDRKRAIFGGDDGVEYLPGHDLDEILAEFGPEQRFLRLRITPEGISVLGPNPLAAAGPIKPVAAAN